MATPASSIADTENPYRIRERPYTSSIDKAAPANASSEAPDIPITVNAKPSRVCRAAPNDAPLATPNVDSVARGFLNMAWKTIPLTARADPARNAVSVRGSLSDQKIDDSMSDGSGCITALIPVTMVPTSGIMTRHAAASTAKNMSIETLFNGHLQTAQALADPNTRLNMP